MLKNVIKESQHIRESLLSNLSPKYSCSIESSLKLTHIRDTWNVWLVTFLTVSHPNDTFNACLFVFALFFTDIWLCVCVNASLKWAQARLLCTVERSEYKSAVSGKSLLCYLRCVSSQCTLPLLLTVWTLAVRQEMYSFIKDNTSRNIVSSASLSGENWLEVFKMT